MKKQKQKPTESFSAKTAGVLKVDNKDAHLVLAHMYVAFIALLLGATAGLLQVLVRSGYFELPAPLGYYQILTIHGVLLALVFTTFFILGFQTAAVSRTSGALSDTQRILGWIGFWLMTIGTIMATIMILLNEASVLYTFYAPLKAHWIFYLGLALLIIGSWVDLMGHCLRWEQWRKENPRKTTPLISFMAVCNSLLWVVATLGVAIEVVFLLLPWSFGLVERVDVLLTRTLFWYFGHALVYFWLLPAYMVWYCVIPKIIGGKIFSDGLARLSFIMFILFSIPVGIHHQLTDPGIDSPSKYIQVVLTMMVVIPSMITAFSMFATFEMRGRELGATGLFGWLKKLPWGDARFLAPFVGMVAFVPGGAGGIINASFQMNQVVHNTIWVTGHFHLTLATTAVLTFFGASYWLIPHLTGRIFTPSLNRLGIIQTICWAVGMLFLAIGMHFEGLLGAPRRSAFSNYGGAEIAETWASYQIAQAIGGTFLFIGIIIFLYICVSLWWFTPKGEQEFPIAELAPQAEKTPPILENFKVWIVILAALILIAYTFPIYNIIENSPIGSKGFKLW
ncbi:b(o/a)3-type cytochrome-c oxidase subunit 1 [Rummeliibacillus sp. POC4]|uniref:b(o/a)3-type cytochrome-c oxidase subunit 1 n=1 Tax=Rummeliibacillus sp. POC4 TaxID=2305899 RepID=UPI000E66F425|nr:b(o/a)3-type cytochrome-c oxidase subunit 1 [Rummeliibacillus sp. POC4]RIJ69602.1 b(o/a)3-type cytochrome-c oxidase subunit 1 [Rummeliibacillus sp. POC4]